MQIAEHSIDDKTPSKETSSESEKALALASLDSVMNDVLDVGIVIVSWNTRDLLRRCLESIFTGQEPTRLQVCVVDNASEDGSPEMVAMNFPQVHLIRSGSNAGYPKANNVGLRWFGWAEPNVNSLTEAGSESTQGQKKRLPRYALLLNPDTELPVDALKQMVQFMDKHQRAGVAGPCLRKLDGSIDKACRRSFPTPLVSFYRQIGLSKLFPKSKIFNAYNMEYLPEDAVHQVDAVVGAYMQVRTEAVESVGLLDEDFFMYGEDLDWAKRFSEGGWEVWYNGQVEVLHIKEASSSQSIKSRIDFHEANWIFYKKHYRQQSSQIGNALIRLGIVLFGGLDVAKHLWRYSRTNV